MNNNIKIGDETIRLPNHQRLKETVQDEAMKRILRSMGDVSKPRFSDDFLSGKLGNNLEKTLSTDYGEEAIVAMFGKDTSANISGLVGYFAEVNIKNNSTQKAEMYCMASEITPSSK